MAPKETSTGAIGTKSEKDHTISLILASMGNPSVKATLIAGMDKHGGSKFAWDHRLRKWKASALKILEENPDLGINFTTTPKRKPKAAAKGPGKCVLGENDNDDDNVSVPLKKRKTGASTAKKPRAIKKEIESDPESDEEADEQDLVKKEKGDSDEDSDSEDGNHEMVFEKAV